MLLKSELSEITDQLVICKYVQSIVLCTSKILLNQNSNKELET